MLQLSDKAKATFSQQVSKNVKRKYSILVWRVSFRNIFGEKQTSKQAKKNKYKLIICLVSVSLDTLSDISRCMQYNFCLNQYFHDI